MAATLAAMAHGLILPVATKATTATSTTPLVLRATTVDVRRTVRLTALLLAAPRPLPTAITLAPGPTAVARTTTEMVPRRVVPVRKVTPPGVQEAVLLLKHLTIRRHGQARAALTTQRAAAAAHRGRIKAAPVITTAGVMETVTRPTRHPRARPRLTKRQAARRRRLLTTVDPAAGVAWGRLARRPADQVLRALGDHDNPDRNNVRYDFLNKKDPANDSFCRVFR